MGGAEARGKHSVFAAAAGRDDERMLWIHTRPLRGGGGGGWGVLTVFLLNDDLFSIGG